MEGTLLRPYGHSWIISFPDMQTCGSPKGTKGKLNGMRESRLDPPCDPCVTHWHVVKHSYAHMHVQRHVTWRHVPMHTYKYTFTHLYIYIHIHTHTPMSIQIHAYACTPALCFATCSYFLDYGGWLRLATLGLYPKRDRVTVCFQMSKPGQPCPRTDRHRAYPSDHCHSTTSANDSCLHRTFVRVSSSMVVS